MNTNVVNTSINKTHRIKPIAGYLLAVALSLLVVFLSLGVGFGEWGVPWQMDEMSWQLRYPRILTALLVGMALSVSGSALQAVFENPLADPSLIGTSGGAALGVVTILAFGIGGIGVPLAAFLGSVGVCFLILAWHRLIGGGVMGLLILGFVVSAFCGALVSLILFFSDDLVLRSATNWLSGSMAESGLVPFSYVIGILVLGLLVLMALGRKLDTLMLGEMTATSMGIDVTKTRILAVIGSALLTAGAVSLAGVIGFIGMMVPNILAVVFGGTRTWLMICSGWLGAIALLMIDTVARWIAYPIDIPVGIVLALLGGPFFIWLFMKAGRS